jgi:hypothetical protein
MRGSAEKHWQSRDGQFWRLAHGMRSGGLEKDMPGLLLDRLAFRERATSEQR